MNLVSYRCLPSASLGSGYIAGTGEGIVTEQGRPSQRQVLLFVINAQGMPSMVRQTWSNQRGEYLFEQIDKSDKYLIMSRDYKKEFEPFAYDWVTPADDLTITEQKALRTLLKK